MNDWIYRDGGNADGCASLAVCADAGGFARIFYRSDSVEAFGCFGSAFATRAFARGEELSIAALAGADFLAMSGIRESERSDAQPHSACECSKRDRISKALPKQKIKNPRPIRSRQRKGGRNDSHPH